jgi:hypothetical protein
VKGFRKSYIREDCWTLLSTLDEIVEAQSSLMDVNFLGDLSPIPRSEVYDLLARHKARFANLGGNLSTSGSCLDYLH